MPDWLYDAKEGTFLGRTGISWLKIIAFYIVYYSVIGLLSVGSLKFYTNLQIPPGTPNETPTVQNLRLDQPGLVAHPVVETLDDKELLIFSKSSTCSGVADQGCAKYLDTMDKFLGKYEKNSATTCTANNKPNTKDVLCKVDNYATYSDNGTKLANAIKQKEPIVFLTVNKIIKWEPLFHENKHEMAFDCYEISALHSDRVADSKFTVGPVAGAANVLSPHAFPFPGLKNDDPNSVWKYNQPFVAIEAKSSTNSFDDGKAYYFRCEIKADNIQGLDENQSKNYNDLIRKLNIGFAEWGVQYTDDA